MRPLRPGGAAGCIKGTMPANQIVQSETVGSLLAEVSRKVVAIHKDHVGKGPLDARASLSNNVLVVILQGGYTRAEQTLAERGKVAEVVAGGLALQEALQSDYRIAVETIMQRGIRSFMSATDPENNLQAEIFVLNAAGEDDLSEGEGNLAAEDLDRRAARARETNRTVLDEHRALVAEQLQARRALGRHS